MARRTRRNTAGAHRVDVRGVEPRLALVLGAWVGVVVLAAMCPLVLLLPGAVAVFLEAIGGGLVTEWGYPLTTV